MDVVPLAAAASAPLSVAMSGDIVESELTVHVGDSRKCRNGWVYVEEQGGWTAGASLCLGREVSAAQASRTGTVGCSTAVTAKSRRWWKWRAHQRPHPPEGLHFLKGRLPERLRRGSCQIRTDIAKAWMYISLAPQQKMAYAARHLDIETSRRLKKTSPRLFSTQ